MRISNAIAENAEDWMTFVPPELAPAKILFVCTGNIFRSMTAEHALKALLGSSELLRVESSGTAAIPQPMHPAVAAAVRKLGLDPSAHRQRKISAEIIGDADIVICFGLAQQQEVKRLFGRETYLFRELTGKLPLEIPDAWEVIPDWENRPAESAEYIESVIREICESMPELLARVERLLAER